MPWRHTKPLGWRHLAIAKSHIVDLFAVLGPRPERPPAQAPPPRGEKVSVSSEVPVAGADADAGNKRGSLK